MKMNKSLAIFLAIVAMTVGIFVATGNSVQASAATNTVKIKLKNKNTNSSYQSNAIQKLNSKLSAVNLAAKNWIANNESHGNYGARNGIYVGKYQLKASYLHGNYSAYNQEKAADSYVKSRYGSWANAKQHWLTHNWY